ncbi:hypothetical protein NPIL_404561 [Nephila pilipes]|uniref:Uncharacterized protein n=1 Tax=Nephila pilipes TaxID=299642 RepID=A0A8X6R4K9_NEPPI|nr:hypothetical protein NPIL_404561 [Nephila pilipes]
MGTLEAVFYHSQTLWHKLILESPNDQIIWIPRPQYLLFESCAKRQQDQDLTTDTSTQGNDGHQLLNEGLFIVETHGTLFRSHAALAWDHYKRKVQ